MLEMRKLTAEDRKSVTALFRDVFTHEPWNDDWSDLKQLDDYITDLTGQNNSLTLGFFDHGALVGLAMGCIKHWHTGTEYLIDEFCVDRRMQGKGIGSAFLKAIEGYLKENGIDHIFLQTERDVPAYAFYRKNGFSEIAGHASLVKRVGD